MSRIITKAMAATAVLGLAGTAFGQVTVDAPEDSANFEFARVDTVLSPTFGSILTVTNDIGGAQTDGDTLTVTINIVAVRSDGTTDVVGQAVAGVGSLDDDQNGTFDDAPVGTDSNAFDIDLTMVPGLGNQLATAMNEDATAILLQIETEDVSGDTLMSVIDVTGTGDINAANESPQVEFDNIQILDAFVDVDNDNLFLVFDRPINFNGGTDSGNASAGVAGVNAAADYQVDGADNFATPTGLGAAPAAVSFLAGSNNTVVQINFADISATNVAAGEFVRVTSTGDGGTDIIDALGEPASNDTDGVEITALAAPVIESVKWVGSVRGGGALDEDGVLEVTFNLPMAADSGDDMFYGPVLQNPDGTDSDITVNNVTAPSADRPNVVILDVTTTGTDQVFANGFGVNGLGFQLATDNTQDIPSSVFAANDFGDDQTVTIDDCITPSVETAASAPSYFDCDGDGTIDGVGFVFDETITGTSAGVTVSKVGATNVFPFGQIEADGTLVMDTIVAGAMASDDAIMVTEVVFDDADIDGVDNSNPAETGNVIIFKFDPSAVDWDEDMMVGADDTDGEATPDTAADDAINVALTAAMSDIADSASNSYDGGDIDDGADDDQAAPALFASLVNDGEAISANPSNLRCFAELNSGNNNDRLIFIFGEVLNPIPTGTELGDGVSIDGTRLDSVGGNPFDIFFDNGPGTNNVLAFTDGLINNNNFDAAGMAFTITSAADIVDGSGNVFTGSGTLTSNTLPYLPIQTGSGNHAAFPIDDDGPGEPGFGFVDSFVLLMSDDLDAADVMMADASDFTIMGSTNTIGSIELDPANSSVLFLNIAETGADQDVSVSSSTQIDYAGSTAMTLVTGDAKDDSFDANEPVQPAEATQTPFTMDITGVLTDNGNPLPIGTEVYAMVAVPTVRSITAEVNGITFRYDRQDLDGMFAAEDYDGYNLIMRSLDNFTDFLLGLDQRLYLHCDYRGLDVFSNNKAYIGVDGYPIGDLEFGQTGDELAGNDNNGVTYQGTTNIDIDVNSSRLSSITFTGRAGDNTVARGTVQLAYDVLRSDSDSLEELFTYGFETYGSPITSKTVITTTDGSYSLHVSLPNLEASDSDDGRSGDANIFATQPLPVILMARLVDGNMVPLSSLVNNASTFNGPILFSAEALTQNSDGSATGASVFNFDIMNVGFQTAFAGYNMMSFPRNSGFVEASNAMPVLPNGITLDSDNDPENIVVGDSLLPSAGPEDQFVWWHDTDENGEWNEGISDIVVDNDSVTMFPFILTSRGVQFGTRGINSIVGGYSFGVGNFATGDYSGSSVEGLGCAQFGPMLNETTIFPTGDFPNNSTTRGWASVTFTGADNTPIDSFFVDNPGTDYVIHFNRTGNNNVEVGSAGSGVTSTDDLDTVSHGDALIIHYNGSN